MALPNILAQKAIVRECLQSECIPDILYHEIYTLLTDDNVYHQQQEDLQKLHQYLQAGSDKPSDKAADIILQHCKI